MQKLCMTIQSKLTTIVALKWIIVAFVIPTMLLSCASLGSKTLYLDKNTTIKTPTKIALMRPTLVNCIVEPDENYNFLEELLGLELAPYDISLEKCNIDYLDFDSIGQGSTSVDYGISNGEFLLFTKLTRLTSMGQTRDYKIEYKLVSILDNKLKFHSKYNTTAGATVVVIPVIKEYPNDDQAMAIAIRSGLYEFKKNLLSKK